MSTSCSGCSAPQALTGSTGSSDGHSHSVSLSCGGCSTPVSLSGNTTTDGEHGHVEKDNNIMKHVHDVLIGEKMRQLQAGDRVLVVWIDSADPCVVDLIFPATALERDANSYEMITG